ncbi:hypothetical protein [Rubrivirga litoralis]|uniref:Lipoprotein n=1 Tax=Rubrivirga litoralis TaxID=3075598 RepID=A0ABU3BM48_9BACT|nr:hypothetical protein [Rubrivirga sp. F394]MDT0630291.1 hypothetical protein [Rubrivirga sp. F394]
MTARALLLGGALLLTACGGSGEAAAPDRYGYRVGGAVGGRTTVALAPPDTTVRTLAFPAVVDSVGVRAAGRPAPGDGVAVEAVVLGAFPDACSALSDVRQERAGHYVTATLAMRQPLETVCAAVVRPFRFYLPLDGAFAAGSYTLKVNDTVVPFQVLPALPEQ